MACQEYNSSSSLREREAKRQKVLSNELPNGKRTLPSIQLPSLCRVAETTLEAAAARMQFWRAERHTHTHVMLRAVIIVRSCCRRCCVRSRFIYIKSFTLNHVRTSHLLRRPLMLVGRVKWSNWSNHNLVFSTSQHERIPAKPLPVYVHVAIQVGPLKREAEERQRLYREQSKLQIPGENPPGLVGFASPFC